MVLTTYMHESERHKQGTRISKEKLTPTTPSFFPFQRPTDPCIITDVLVLKLVITSIRHLQQGQILIGCPILRMEKSVMHA